MNRHRYTLGDAADVLANALAELDGDRRLANAVHDLLCAEAARRNGSDKAASAMLATCESIRADLIAAGARSVQKRAG